MGVVEYYTFLGAEEWTGATTDAGPGNRYVTALVEFTGIAAKSAYNPFFFVVRDASGFEYPTTFPTRDPSLGASNSLAPGETVRGWVTFEVPKAGALRLVYALPGQEPVSIALGAIAVAKPTPTPTPDPLASFGKAYCHARGLFDRRMPRTGSDVQFALEQWQVGAESETQVSRVFTQAAGLMAPVTAAFDAVPSFQPGNAAVRLYGAASSLLVQAYNVGARAWSMPAKQAAPLHAQSTALIGQASSKASDAYDADAQLTEQYSIPC